MTEPIVYIDRSRIRPGRLPELKAAIEDLVVYIEEREPRLLAYGFHLDGDESRMTVVAVHPDPASVELHMEIGRKAFGGFADFIEMDGIEVYGEATDRMLEQLEEKARALGSGRVVVDRQYAGFTRLGEATTAPHRP